MKISFIMFQLTSTINNGLFIYIKPLIRNMERCLDYVSFVFQHCPLTLQFVCLSCSVWFLLKFIVFLIL